MKVPMLMVALFCGLAKNAIQQVPPTYSFPFRPPWVTTTLKTTLRTQRGAVGEGQIWQPGYPTPPSNTPKTERPTKRPPIILTEKLTPRMCTQPRYKHLRACFYALNSRYQARLDMYTRKYLCKEWAAKEKNDATQASVNNRAFGVPNHAAVARAAPMINPCTTSEIPHDIKIIEAEDMYGNNVELLTDIKNQLFQTFFTKDCSDYASSNFKCEKVHAIIETSVWVDVKNDNDPENDVPVLKKVKIPVDCALHQDLF